MGGGRISIGGKLLEVVIETEKGGGDVSGA